MHDPLDIEQPDALVAYLRDTGRIARDEMPHIRTLAGGVSNRTVLVGRPCGHGWVLKQALPKLRVAVDWFSDPARIRREALGLRWLPHLSIPGTTTPLVFEDERHHLLAMQAVPQPHENWKAALLSGRLEMRHVTRFAYVLGTIHRRAFEGRDRVAPAFDDRSFFESLRLEPYYAYTATQVPTAATFLNDLIRETLGHRLTLVHGDASPKNVLIYQQRYGWELALIDHEVIHYGDPAFDVGFFLTHLLSKAHHLAQLRSRFGHAVWVFWRNYHDALGALPWVDALEFRVVRHALGCLLARVAGRSPLEYLTPEERAWQRERVLRLMADPPPAVSALVESFLRP